MQRRLFFTLILTIVISSPLGVGADPFSLKPLPNNRIIEDFSADPPGKFPTSFKTYPFQRGKAMRVYKVQSEGENHFLNAAVGGDTQNLAVQIFRNFYWELSRWPILSWRWRARALPAVPPGTHERFDDNACGVYVVFGGFGGKALKYIWSSDLPVGKTIEDTPNQFYVMVVAGGPKNLGTWQKVSFNIIGEYRRVFKSTPFRNPVGIGILTDGDGTHSPAICDYDDFQISSL